MDLFLSVYCGLRTSMSYPGDDLVSDEIDNQKSVDNGHGAYHIRFMVDDPGPTAKQHFNSFSVVNRWSNYFRVSPEQIADEVNNTPNSKWHAIPMCVFEWKGTKHDIITKTKHLCHGGFEFSQIIKESIGVANLFNSRIHHTKTYACIGERVKVMFLWECTTSNSWFSITQYTAECHCIVFHC